MALRMALVLALALLCGHASGVQHVNPNPGPKVFGCYACYNPKYTYVGIIHSQPIAATERDCFYTCAEATNVPLYQWNQMNKVCTCYDQANVTNCVADNPAVAATDGYNVSGSVNACFPFCSIAITSCNRCYAVPKTTCVQRSVPPGRKRCCCLPPRQVQVKNGYMVGCHDPVLPTAAMSRAFTAQEQLLSWKTLNKQFPHWFNKKYKYPKGTYARAGGSALKI
jgi:hypothetical protein